MSKDADYLSLKWGSLKSIRMRTPAVEAAFERYESIGTHHGSALFHKDSLEQKAALCDLIDAVAAAGGQIQGRVELEVLHRRRGQALRLGGRGPRAIDRGRGDRAERDAVG